MVQSKDNCNNECDDMLLRAATAYMHDPENNRIGCRVLCVTATDEKKRGEEFLPTAVVYIHTHVPLNSTVASSVETQTLD